MIKQDLQRIYKKLYRHFGPQHWWPARTRIEVIIGTVLTQNTAWTNVEKAIRNLRRHKLLSLKRLRALNTQQLAYIIKPAGYFNIKAKRLKNVLDFFYRQYQGNIQNARRVKAVLLREQLLSVNGIGPETADSILLYALDMPSFVIDAYTKRVFSRLGLLSVNTSYESAQARFMNNLPSSRKLFNEFHALIVKAGKEYCKKKKPRCHECPLQSECYD